MKERNTTYNKKSRSRRSAVKIKKKKITEKQMVSDSNLN